jgi:hypothetical protein
MKAARKTQVKYDNVTRPSRLSSIVTGENLRQGFLQKLSTGAIKRWQKRYFVVAGHYLNYTEDEDHAQEHDAIKASINLYDVTEYDASDNKITLAIGTEKHQFKAEDQADADEWLKVMHMVTAEHRDQQMKKSLGHFQIASKAGERQPEIVEEPTAVKTTTLESWLDGENLPANKPHEANDVDPEGETGLQRGRKLTFTMSVGSNGSTTEAGAAANYAAAKAAQEEEEGARCVDDAKQISELLEELAEAEAENSELKGLQAGDPKQYPKQCEQRRTKEEADRIAAKVLVPENTNINELLEELVALEAENASLKGSAAAAGTKVWSKQEIADWVMAGTDASLEAATREILASATPANTPQLQKDVAAGEGSAARGETLDAGLQRGRKLTFTMSVGSDGSTTEAGAAANYAAAKAAQEEEEVSPAARAVPTAMSFVMAVDNTATKAAIVGRAAPVAPAIERQGWEMKGSEEKLVDLTAPYQNDGSHSHKEQTGVEGVEQNQNLTGLQAARQAMGERQHRKRMTVPTETSAAASLNRHKTSHQDLHPGATYQGDGDEVDDDEWD